MCTVNYYTLHLLFCTIFGRAIACVGHSFADVAHFVFLRHIWIRTQRAASASRCATNLAIHLPNLAIHPDRKAQDAYPDPAKIMPIRLDLDLDL